jgi:hypothetical protein
MWLPEGLLKTERETPGCRHSNARRESAAGGPTYSGAADYDMTGSGDTALAALAAAIGVNSAKMV